MCSVAKLGRNTVKPGSSFLVHAMRGSSLEGWGIGVSHNARIESLKTTWKNFERIYLHLSGFYEGQGYFEMQNGKQLTVAGISDGMNFNIVTTPAVGIVASYHHRMPVILADWDMWLIRGFCVVMPSSHLKLAV